MTAASAAGESSGPKRRRWLHLTQAGTCPWTRQLAAFLELQVLMFPGKPAFVVVKTKEPVQGGKLEKKERDKDPNSWDVSELQKGK